MGVLPNALHELHTFYTLHISHPCQYFDELRLSQREIHSKEMKIC